VGGTMTERHEATIQRHERHGSMHAIDARPATAWMHAELARAVVGRCTPSSSVGPTDPSRRSWGFCTTGMPRPLVPNPDTGPGLRLLGAIKTPATERWPGINLFANITEDHIGCLLTMATWGGAYELGPVRLSRRMASEY
jgi:hypothetical protein